MSRDANCIFCKIIEGKIPCHLLYEDKQTLAFLDIGPLSRGHSLVIPKSHYVTLETMPIELATACMKTVARVGTAVLGATGAEAWNVLQNNGPLAGQVVGHVHFHIIPRADSDGLGFRWPTGTLTDLGAKELTEAILAAL